MLSKSLFFLCFALVSVFASAASVETYAIQSADPADPFSPEDVGKYQSVLADSGEQPEITGAALGGGLGATSLGNIDIIPQEELDAQNAVAQQTE